MFDAVAAVLADAANNIPRQIYHFDAYGNLLNLAGQQPQTSYLYSGEAFDFKIGQQYLRARWYDATTGRFNRLDPFYGNQTDPRSFQKYAYVHGDPIQGIDPTGLFTLGGVLTGITIGTTILAAGFPLFGAAILTATGQLNLWGLAEELSNPVVWATAVVGVTGGGVANLGVQALLLKLGKSAAKKITPGMGLLFAAFGLHESIKLTVRMLNEELPNERAERYVASLLATSMLTVIFSQSMKHFAAKGVRNDADFWKLEAADKKLYEAGSQILPTREWNKLDFASKSPVERGRVLTESYSSAKRFFLGVKGALETITNFGNPDRLDTFEWLSSGLTPVSNFIYSDNAMVSLTNIFSSQYFSVQIVDDLLYGNE